MEPMYFSVQSDAVHCSQIERDYCKQLKSAHTFSNRKNCGVLNRFDDWLTFRCIQSKQHTPSVYADKLDDVI